MRIIESIRRAWCKQFHRSTYWPLSDRYLCKTCLREYAVHWSEKRQPATGIDKHWREIDELEDLFRR